MKIMPIQNSVPQTFTSLSPIRLEADKLIPLVEQGLTYKQIAEIFNTSIHTVRKNCLALGLKTKGNNKINYDQFDEKKIKSLVNQGKSLNQIGKILGRKTSGVRCILRHFGLQTKQSKAIKSIDMEKLKAMVDAGMSQKQIAKYLEINDPGALTPLLKKCGYRPTKAIVDNITKFELEAMLQLGMTIENIANKYCISHQYIKRKLAQYGLKTNWQIANERTITLDEIKKCVEQNMTLVEIEKKFKVSKFKILKILKENNLQTTSQIAEKSHTKSEVKKAIAGCKSYRQLAQKLNIASCTARNLVLKYGLQLDK